MGSISLGFRPLELEEEKEEKAPKKEAVEGPHAVEEERKKEEPEEGQAAQEVKKEEKNKGKASTEEEEDPTDQVLIRACIEESFEEAETPSYVLISIKEKCNYNELSLLFNEMNFNFAYLFDVFPNGFIH
ncbi:hypothetical protein JCGZ_22706 [Jatropha curcas]|uniref:Uncharacterized protein n=1 Tax=Jatropha curcas TaxID=180498 RepID=A0A067JPT2_JATCU|nr:hypothetical protein JCGZ_22706 [Jatropha curcas]